LVRKPASCLIRTPNGLTDLVLVELKFVTVLRERRLIKVNSSTGSLPLYLAAGVWSTIGFLRLNRAR
jgi:hypothetical protein